MADTKLKTCPFCGGKADIIVQKQDPYCPEFGRTVKINCRCGICTHTSVYQDESDLKEVIEYWNKRTAADVQLLSIVAEHIKQRLYETALNEPDTVASDVIADMAERIDFWIDELKEYET